MQFVLSGENPNIAVCKSAQCESPPHSLSTDTNRFEPGNAASISERMQLAKLKWAHSDNKAVEHVARNKRCASRFQTCGWNDIVCCHPYQCYYHLCQD